MNMKKTILISLLTVISLSMTAQEKLIRIDSEDIAWQKDNPQYLFFNKEMARLLMPQGAAFGVECIPSFSPEWSLSYDSVAHALIYNEAQKSIWYSTYNAMYKKKTKTKNGRKISQRKATTVDSGFYEKDFSQGLGIAPDVIIPLPMARKFTDNIDEWVQWVAEDLKH